jgi:membrane protease subunit HflK
MQQILSSSTKIMLDYKGSGNLLYLPLDKLMQQAATLPALGEPAAGAVRVVPPETAPADSGRARDSLRGRERGERP